MKISRWIFIPLFLAIYCGFAFAFMYSGNPLQNFASGFLIGAVLGFIFKGCHHYRASYFSAKNTEDFSVKQNRDFIVRLNCKKAFEICEAAVTKDSYNSIKLADEESGIIKAKNKMNLFSFGTKINIKLKQIGQNLTEISIIAMPVFRPTVIDYGESLRVIEKITSYIKYMDAEINKGVLTDGTDISSEFFVNPFQKNNSF